MNKRQFVYSPSSCRARLCVVKGNTTKSLISIPLPCMIGRGSESDLTIDHPTVSRQHCLLDLFNNSIVVTDLDSRNGTCVDNDYIDHDERVVLEPGHTFTVGPVTFRIEYDFSKIHETSAVYRNH